MNPGPESRSILPASTVEITHREALAPPPPAMPDALALLVALRRRAKMATALGLVAATVAAVAAYYITPPAKYSARSMLHVASEQPRILVKTSEAQSDYSSYQRTQLAMLRSRLVLGAALKLPDVAGLDVVKGQVEPVEWLEKELQVDFANGSEMLRVGISGKNPGDPATLVNAVVQAYIDEVVNVEVKQRRERADMLKEVWNRYQENLRSKRDEVRRLTMATGSDDKQAQAYLRLSEAERVAKADSELARTRDELRRLKVELEVLERVRGTTQISQAAIDEELAADPSLARLVEQAEQTRARYEQAWRKSRDAADPSVRIPRQAAEAAIAALESGRAKIRLAIADQHARRANGVSPDVETLRERAEVLAGLESLQAEDVGRLVDRGRATTQAAVDLTALREEIAHADELAKRIGGEVEALNLELQAPPRVRLRERAEMSRTKDELRQVKASGVAALGAFAVVLLGVSTWEFRARRVDSPAEVTRGLGIRIVGTLPALPRGGMDGRRGRTFQNLMIESVDSARASLLHATRDSSIRVVMVASAMGGEGKTSLACHLAASLSRAGRKTLLLDCDLRRPSAHRVLDLPGEVGVCEILRGEIAPEDAIQATSASCLSLLPAGRCDSKALQALGREEAGLLFADLRQRFEYIVVDTPPVLPVADTLLIGHHVDAALFSVMRDVSRMPKVHAAFERLSALGIRMLGAIVAGTRSELHGNEYYYSAPPHDRG